MVNLNLSGITQVYAQPLRKKRRQEFQAKSLYGWQIVKLA